MIREELFDKNGRKILFSYYDDILSLMNMKIENKNNQRVGVHYTESYKPSSTSWWGWSGGYSELKNKIEHGWKGALDFVNRNLSDVIDKLPQIRSVKRVRRRGSSGDSIDIHRVISGDLDKAWQYTDREMSNSLGQNNVTIVVNICVSSMTDSSSAMWLGFTAIALAEKLIESGRNVQIISTASVTALYKGHNDISITSEAFLIKDFNQHIDIEQALVLTSVGAFRGLVFKALANKDIDVTQSLGYPTNTKIFPEWLVGNGNTIEIPISILSKDVAEKFIIDAINNINGEDDDTRF